MKTIKDKFFLLLLSAVLFSSCAKEDLVDIPEYIKKEYVEKTDKLGEIHILAEQYDQDSAFVTLNFTVDELPEEYAFLNIISGGNTYSTLRAISVQDENGEAYPYQQKYVTGFKNEDRTLRRQIGIEVAADQLRNVTFSITIYINLVETLGESDTRKSFSTTYVATKHQDSDGKEWKVPLNQPQKSIYFPLHKG